MGDGRRAMLNPFEVSQRTSMPTFQTCVVPYSGCTHLQTFKFGKARAKCRAGISDTSPHNKAQQCSLTPRSPRQALSGGSSREDALAETLCSFTTSVVSPISSQKTKHPSESAEAKHQHLYLWGTVLVCLRSLAASH